MIVGFKICQVILVQKHILEGGHVEVKTVVLRDGIKDTFDTYQEAEAALKGLPNGHYQIQKIYTV